MGDLPDVLQAPDLGSFEFTFSNRELEDVLGFIERRQSGLPLGEEDATLPPMLPPSAPLSLQFQPHPVTVGDSVQPAAAVLDPFGGTHPMDPFLVQPVVSAPAAAQPASALVRSRGGSPDPTGAAPPQPMILNTDIAPAAMTVSTRSRAAAGNASAAAPVPHGSGVKHREGKAPVSHSTIEKQRRDRINSLIDELRDLVPPHSHPLPHDDLEGHPHDGAKRPKHAVLSDTIALVKELKSKLSVAEDEMARLGRISPKPSPFSSEAGDALMAAPRAPMAAAGVAAGGCLGQTAQEGTAPMPIVASTEAGGLVSAHVPPPSPSAPNGVSVDPGEGCMYVKVHCKDRHGLLADIVRSLKAINLEITTAAITTTASEEGAFVYDVFQVKAPGSPTASADDIKATVEAAMGAGAAAVDGHAGKRLRSALA